MKKHKSFALIVALTMVLNMVIPMFSNVLAQEKTGYLEVFQFNTSGVDIYTGQELKANIGGEEIVEGFIWREVTVGTPVTITYTPTEENQFIGWYNDEDELISSELTYSFTMEEGYHSYRATSERKDGTIAMLDVQPYPLDFGYNKPDYDLDYQTFTIENRGNVPVRNIEMYYDDTLVDVKIGNNNYSPIATLDVGDKVEIKAKPISGAFEVDEFDQEEWINIGGDFTTKSGEDYRYNTQQIVRIGVNETGTDPYNKSMFNIRIEGYNEKPQEGQALPRYEIVGDDPITMVNPNGIYWEKYDTSTDEWVKVQDEELATIGSYRLIVNVFTEQRVEENQWAVAAHTDDAIISEPYVENIGYDSDDTYCYFTCAIYVATIEEMYTFTYDANGGTKGPQWMDESKGYGGMVMEIVAPETSFVAPPAGKVFDGYIINGERYYVGQAYQIEGDVNFKFVWSDEVTELTPIYNIHLTLEEPKVGTKNMKIFDVVSGDTGTVHPTVIKQPDEHIEILDTEWIKGTYQTAGNEFMDIFEGTFEAGKDYYAIIAVKAEDGYKLDGNVLIKVNNQPPAEVFPVYNGINTFFIAKIKTQNNPSDYTVGDINGDGKINADDAADAIEIFKTNAQTPENIAKGDMDGNGRVTAEDSALIIEYFKTHH